MNLKDNFLFILAIFPIFSLKSNFNYLEISYIFLILFSITIINFFISGFLRKRNNKLILNIYLSLVISIGLDNHLGLFNGIIQPNNQFLIRNFKIIYAPAILLFFIIWLSVLIIKNKTEDNKNSTIFIVTLLSLLIFNIFDNTKDYKQIPNFSKKVNKVYNERTLILILDEMSGFNSMSSDTKEGKEFNNEIKNMFSKYNFEYYTNSFSISDNSVNSIGSLINFESVTNKEIRDKLVKVSDNYFIEYEMKQNKLFNKYENISVVQNLHINYCNFPNVSDCYQFNPYRLDIIEADSDIISKIISLWNLNGSILAKLTWRSFKQLEIIQSINEPEGEKLFHKQILNFVKNKVLSKKYDLIFVHILVPHKPYGFNEICKYDVQRSNLNYYMTEKEEIKQHNIERKCVVKSMDIFFQSLGNLNNINIFVISDHGSRIKKNKRSSLSNIFAHKNFNTNNPLEIKIEKISQEIFRKKFDE